MCESRNPQRDRVAVLTVKILIMINLCDSHHVICFIISSGVKHDMLIYSYCEFNLCVEGLLAGLMHECIHMHGIVRAACAALTNQLVFYKSSMSRRDGGMEG